MVKEKYYITTAIDYVNAKPHVGHAFEKVISDVIARWNRLQDKDVFFLTGVDENAQKNVQAAEKAGIPVKEFVDKNTAFFLELSKKLNISHNDFIRTSASEHGKVVQKIIQKILDKGDIYKGEYSGLYCTGCESYYTEKELVDGKCPEHNTVPEQRKEEAYFFKLSKYQDQLLKLIPKYVTPKSKANEVLVRVKEGLNDINISRKDVEIGVPFPSHEDFKVWVWIDALINYVSGLKSKEKKYWPADTHVIGKGINWFHSVIWPAILLSADYPLPKKLLVHGYLNISGKKMSKSTGNTIDPLDLLEKYNADTVRYSLLRNTVFEDSDYSESLLQQRHNDELANKLGNLVSRVSALAEKYGIEKPVSSKLNSSPVLKSVTKHLENYETDRALNEIFAFIDKTNEYIQKKKPWETKSQTVLYELANAIKDATILLSPFLPETSEKIAKIFNFSLTLKDLKAPLKVSKIKKSPILFEKIK
ncbi:methionine--tRNA ligase [Candidatus Pacearchaeota archaeon]|nr:methionine--tRNA ligase [Candidatus Pacearchaeota archaeon]|tara:strand:+ start:5759 stop:7186 length:1428 start_codon:yes stop_codon:yes gene_type:complete